MNTDFDDPVVKYNFIAKKYGLTEFELHILYGLNDKFIFTFEEFAEILTHAPKSYNNKFYESKQRFLDSLKWIEFIRTFRNDDFLSPDTIIISIKQPNTWKEYIDTQLKFFNWLGKKYSAL
jgi:hypothetical protein